jgi:peptidoglycan/LPS O-acetylase OafA/YrhL
MVREDKRILGLDVWRAYAILCVVYGHGYNLVWPHLSKPLYDLPRVDGVTLFFILSGFLLGRVLLRTASAEHFSFQALLRFWIRRGMRTLPAYFIMLTLLLIATFCLRQRGWPLTTVHGAEIFQFYTLTQNIARPHPEFFGEAWSLSLIEWFYLLTPLLLFLLLRGVHGEARQRRILYWIVSIIVADTVLRFYWVHVHVFRSVYDWDIGLRKESLMRMDLLMYGVLAAYLSVKFPKQWLRLTIPASICGVTLIILDKVFSVSAHPLFYLSYFNLTVLPLGVALLLPLASSWNPALGALPALRALRWVADVSYSLYLVNLTCVQKILLPVFMVVLERWCPQCGSSYLLPYIYYWCLCLIAAGVLHRCVERPVSELRERSNAQKVSSRLGIGVAAGASG